MRVGGSPRLIQRPAAPVAEEAPAASTAGKSKKPGDDKGPNLGDIKPAKAALVGFGETSDATADINPETSPKNKVKREGAAAELAGIPADFMKTAMLPSEQQGVSELDSLDKENPFGAQDEAFDAAGGDMERGLQAQGTIGRKRAVDVVEDPNDVAAMGDSENSDPSNPNSVRGKEVQGIDPELLGLGRVTLTDSNVDDPLQQDFRQLLSNSRMRGLPSRNNKSA